MKNNTCPKPKPKKVFLSLFAVSLLSVVFALKKAQAQTTFVSYTISPPTLQFTLKPGEKTEKILKITNHTTNTLEFVTTTVDFVVNDKAGTPELLPVGTLKDNRFAASSWSTVLPDTITVEPGKTATTTLYLQVPGDARPGGRYFAVTFRPLNAGVLDQSGAMVNPVTGSLVYLTVAGQMKEKAEVTQFKVPSFSEYGPIKFMTEIKNTGDVHINPKATIEVKNLFGKTVFTSALANLNIFPGTSRVYENSWEEKILFGKYNAKLSGYYGTNGNLPLTAIATFWVIPYKLIAIAVLTIAIILLLIFGFRKKEKSQGEEEK